MIRFIIRYTNQEDPESSYTIKKVFETLNEAAQEVKDEFANFLDFGNESEEEPKLIMTIEAEPKNIIKIESEQFGAERFFEVWPVELSAPIQRVAALPKELTTEDFTTLTNATTTQAAIIARERLIEENLKRYRDFKESAKWREAEDIYLKNAGRIETNFINWKRPKKEGING